MYPRKAHAEQGIHAAKRVTILPSRVFTLVALLLIEPAKSQAVEANFVFSTVSLPAEVAVTTDRFRGSVQSGTNIYFVPSKANHVAVLNTAGELPAISLVSITDGWPTGANTEFKYDGGVLKGHKVSKTKCGH